MLRSGIRSISRRFSDRKTRVGMSSSWIYASNTNIPSEEFVDMLTEMRFGRLTSKSIQRFKMLSRSIDYGDDLGPTELYVCTRILSGEVLTCFAASHVVRKLTVPTLIA